MIDLAVWRYGLLGTGLMTRARTGGQPRCQHVYVTPGDRYQCPSPGYRMEVVTPAIRAAVTSVQWPRDDAVYAWCGIHAPSVAARRYVARRSKGAA